MSAGEAGPPPRRDGPDTYTHGHHDAVLRSHRWRTAANSAPHLLPLLRPGLDVLDVGCGPGTITGDLAEAVAPGRVVGVDLSAEVVAEARDHLDRRGLGRVELLAGDVRHVDLAAASFDVAHAHQVLQHLRDPVGTLVAIAALVRPGGLVAVRDADYPAMRWSPTSPALDRWLEVYLAVTAANGANADAGRHLATWAEEAGLVEVATSSSSWTFERAEDVAWWGGLWAERTTSSSFGAQAVAYGVATAEELDEVAAGWRAWATAPGASFTVPHGEVLATTRR